MYCLLNVVDDEMALCELGEEAVSLQELDQVQVGDKFNLGLPDRDWEVVKIEGFDSNTAAVVFLSRVGFDVPPYEQWTSVNPEFYKDYPPQSLEIFFNPDGNVISYALSVQGSAPKGIHHFNYEPTGKGSLMRPVDSGWSVERVETFEALDFESAFKKVYLAHCISVEQGQSRPINQLATVAA